MFVRYRGTGTGTKYKHSLFSIFSGTEMFCSGCHLSLFRLQPTGLLDLELAAQEALGVSWAELA